jgi:FkbM family methyltransferase
MIVSAFESLLRLYARIAPSERGGYRLARFARSLQNESDRRGIFRTPAGYTLDLDLETYPDVSMAYGLYEIDTARVIKRILKPGDHFVDGGANIGYFTLLAAKCIGPAGRIDAFEPQPENRARLIENLRRNGMEARVNVHAEALSDCAGTATIHRPLDATLNHGASSLFVHPESAQQKTDEVITVRMDEALAGTTPRLIKLDLEGAEPLAIAGMTNLIKNSPPPAIITELNTLTAQAAGASPTAAIDMLLAAQPAYNVYIIGWRRKRIDPASPELAKREQVNLLFEAR